ncbi:deoxyguanosinetriphosphate triphosphohydrolase [Chloroflexota bacterium]
MIERLNIRQKTEEKEESLSPLAVKSRQSQGRQEQEEPDAIRTAFQRDRDRIIYSKAYRRLKHKTQAFIAPQGDHYVTRLTHTLQVSQIARTLARALNLNEDLTEAIAMGHDLGHTPFGHIGEDVLNEIYPGGFRHNEQSLRVVDLLENDGKGLNLTWEVRDGILNHSKSGVNIMGKDWGKVNTLEGEIVKISDTLAWINHDIDDAIRAGVITEDDLPASATGILGNSHRERMSAMVGGIIEQSWVVRDGNTVNPGIKMSPGVLEAVDTLRKFLFDRVYNRQAAEEESNKAREVVHLLYNYYAKHQDKMPPEYSLYSDELERRVVDYIAGMTDRYASNLAEEIKG